MMGGEEIEVTKSTRSFRAGSIAAGPPLDQSHHLARSTRSFRAGAEADPAVPVTVDLDRRSVTVRDRDPGARWSAGFAIDDYSRWRLMAGLDDISLAIQHDGEITADEARRSPWMPTAG
jgi:3-isopropylmalate dehydratase small subunit